MATPSIVLPATRDLAPSVARAAVVVLAAIAVAWATSAWSADARAVATVFAAATAAWVVTKVDDTLVALLAAVALVAGGAVPASSLFSALGDPTVWLLIGSCLLAAGVTASGLVERASGALVSRARTVRGLAHRTAIALTLTAFVVPATSGRAALAVPLFRALATGMPRPLQIAWSLLFPAVILLSAFVSILGAGAHLIAAEFIDVATGVDIGFVQWMLLGAPVALVTVHLAVEVVLVLFLAGPDRRFRVAAHAAAVPRPRGPLAAREWRALAVLATVLALWVTEPWHGLHAAVVALLGGVALMLPGVGTITPKKALEGVPWSLLLFLATTLALGTALVDSGAASRIADALMAAVAGASPVAVFCGIVGVSLAAHLVVQSRSARATVLLPVVLVAATAAGIHPAAAALASTAAAGFCLTLTSSAKPVAMFAGVEGVATFDRRTLLVFSTVLAPFVGAVILVAAAWVWPALGIPLVP